MDWKNKKNITQQVDDLVKYLDDFMSRPNAGHLNIKVAEDGQVDKEELHVDNTGECCNSACKAPTLFEGLDINNEEED